MKSIAKFIVLLGVFALGFLVYKKYQPSKQTSFPYAGTLEATRVDLASRLPSVVSSVEVREGEKIKAGQKLISLACEDVKLASALAHTHFNRAHKLHDAGTMPDEAFESAEHAKKEAELRLSWCEISSPLEGRVLTQYQEEGEWVYPGAKLLSLADLKKIWAYFYVPQKLMSRLKVGDKVVGIIPELDGKKFKGTIQKINDEAEFTPKNVQTKKERTRLIFGVKIAFENEEEILKPGMTIEVSWE